jgi:tellurite resistance protein
MQALEDGIITTQEEEQLEKIKESIVKRAYIIARKDNKISPDEKNLISKIAAYMVERRKEVFWKVFGTSPRPK